MRTIEGSEIHVGTEYFVIDVDSEPTLIKFNTQIDDLLISAPDGDVLIAWDVDGWDDSQCLLVKTFDNLKELGNLKCTRLLIKARDKATKCWLVAQRN